MITGGTPILGNHHMNMGLSPAEYMHVRKNQQVSVGVCCQMLSTSLPSNRFNIDPEGPPGYFFRKGKPRISIWGFHTWRYPQMDAF